MEKIPTPKGWPFIGNTYDVDFVQQTASLETLAETYGPTYKVRLMQGDYVVCSDFELFDELCDEKRFTKHPAGGLDELRHGLGDGLFTARFGEYNWEIAHRVVVPVFGPMAISKMFDDMHDVASQLVLKWARHGPESRISSTDDFTKLTLDTIALCSMGTRFNSFYHDEVHPFAQSMTKVMVESGKRGSRAKIANYLMRGSSNEFFDNINVMQSVCQGIIDKRRANPSEKNDLVNAMLHRKDPKTGKLMSDANITNNMITFLFAGHETTSGFLAFLFYEFLKNPTEIKKAQKEVDEVVGAGQIKPEHLTKLHFLTACLRETIRLHPPAAATYMVTNPENKDDPVNLLGGKYQVPRGTVFRNLIRLIQTDPDVYGDDAQVFRPERMLDEQFNMLPRNAWKPFGNGSRACIGRDFAWQEAMLVIAMLLQNFDFSLVDPDYELQIQQTLTVKPMNLFIHAVPRAALDPSSIEKRLFTDTTPTTTPGLKEAAGSSSHQETSRIPLAVFFGGNMGTCEGLTQTVSNAASSRGFRAQVRPLDDATRYLTKDAPNLIITSSYEGQPPDNACKFVDWIENAEEKDLAGVRFAVFGCGNRHWKETYQRIPKICDAGLEKSGAQRLTERGIADASNNAIFDEFEKWEDDSFWPSIMNTFGGEEKTISDGVPSLDMAISSPQDISHPSSSDVQETRTLKNRTLARSDDGELKKHIELQLPDGSQYRAGDYLAILPMNPPQTVKRVTRRFQLPSNATLFIRSEETFLPHGVPLQVRDVLASYVELSQPATQRNIKTLLYHTTDCATKQNLTSMSGDYFSSSITARRASLLDLLEAHPAINLPFATYLAMLPSLRPRQYSISSSPLANPSVCTLTYSVLDSPSSFNKSQRFLGVATNYLSALRPGDHIMATTQASAPSFHLPQGAAAIAPVIMLCAGTGIAPFRGFIQERAALMAKGERMGPALLYFGCRDPQTDALYHDELQAWARIGAVDLRWAFSRKSCNGEGHGQYVQDRFLEDSKEIRELFEIRKGLIFVCGSQRVADGVEGALRRMRREWVSEIKSGESTEEWLEHLKGERYLTDVFD